MTTLNSSTSSTITFSLQNWRENFLRVILRVALIFGLLALIPSLRADVNPVLVAINIGTYILLMLMTFAPLPYLLRAWVVISLSFTLGIVGLVDTGIWGDSRLFFLATVVFTGMLVSPRAAIGTTVASLGMTALVGWLLIDGRITLINVTMVQVAPWQSWVTSGTALLMLDAVAIIGLSMLQGEFQRAQARAQTSLKELERERFQLEKRVEERTTEIATKTRQLEAASTVARKIVEIRDLQLLLNNVVNGIADQFNLYHVGIFMLDDKEQSAVLQAASSEGGQKMLKLGHRLTVGQTGIVGYVTARGRPRVALDTGTDAVFFDNPYLPLTHSEMALPLIVRSHVIGALDIQSEKVNAFTEGDVEIMQTVADQLASAIENTRLFTENEAVISQFESLNALQTREAWSNYLKRRTPAYQYTALGIRPLTPSRSEADSDSGHDLRIPIELRSQEIGVIHLRRKATSPEWSQREQELAAEIAIQVALALDTNRLVEETQKNAARDQMIASVSNKVRQTLDMETILQTAADELRNAFNLTEAEVRLNPSSAAGSNGKGQG
jgi:GAF domain-containing protein